MAANTDQSDASPNGVGAGGFSNALHQLKYGLLPLILVVSSALLLAGGAWLWLLPIIVVSFATWIDEAFGNLDADHALNPVLMNAWLISCLPLTLVMSLLTSALAGAETGFIAWLDASLLPLGVDFAANRAATSAQELTAAVLGVGILFGAAAVNVAHELIHRADKLLYTIGRWLLAFTFDTTFAIEHVYGHHRYVATRRDPATARRGEYVLAFVWRSTIGQFVNAFEIETKRLSRKNLPIVSHHNKALRGQFMSVALVLLHLVLVGWPGLIVFVLLGLPGKMYLEIVNYVEHYGLVREEGSRVEPRHSWNCDRLISNTLLFNLPRHSHHHANASKPFWELHSLEGAPLMPHGYKVMMLLSLFPPLWNSKLEPLLDRWEADLATEGEKRIIAEERGALSAG
ncbi:MAG: alkane 1-monooxygenase [Pseudomonadota bacterium]